MTSCCAIRTRRVRVSPLVLESLLMQLEQSSLPRRTVPSKPGIRTLHQYQTPSPLAPMLTMFGVSPTGNEVSPISTPSVHSPCQPRARLDCIWLVRSYHQALGPLPCLSSATHAIH